MNDFNETLENLNEMGTDSYANLRKLGEMQMANWNKMVEKQMEVFSLVANSLVQQTELASEAKDYSDIMRGQMTLNQKLAEELMAKGQESAEMVQQAGEEYRQWAEDVTQQTSDKIAAAQKAA